MTFAELATTLLITATPVDAAAIDKNIIKVEIQNSLQSELSLINFEHQVKPVFAAKLDKQTSVNENAE
ncbi:hypothetical protein KO525_15605 [Psychrosphaera sp. B3R10]|uniref:Uncharacterized protein n=1 Tax=Psychrosphaera algicola TaxID=3023714 RepID=A0ABT5FJN3_9GAMM|nr:MULTISPECIES: hypothetical protein [unclassified Psychrosphaera]MBU2880964.1 hypothetical protein [Psychrosphaera sp. I2R16]MBU2990817.1 hypothetical protein [Psychrosphaera sp. B3R10]MDC2891410.1 hypothetical protein [Psychrosphaera sp. G1-22]